MASTLSDFQSADTLRFVAQESLAHALKLQQKAELLQDEVRSIMEDAEKEAAPLQNEINQLLAARDRIITKHQHDGVDRDGSVFIAVDKKPREVMDADAFRATYPDEFMKVFAKVGFNKFKPTKDEAALELSSYQIEKICKKQGEITYKLDQDLRAIMPEKAAEVEQ